MLRAHRRLEVGIEGNLHLSPQVNAPQNSNHMAQKRNPPGARLNPVFDTLVFPFAS